MKIGYYEYLILIIGAGMDDESFLKLDASKIVKIIRDQKVVSDFIPIYFYMKGQLAANHDEPRSDSNLSSIDTSYSIQIDPNEVDPEASTSIDTGSSEIRKFFKFFLYNFIVVFYEYFLLNSKTILIAI